MDQRIKTLLCVLGIAVALGFANGRDLVPALIWIVPGLALALWRSLPLRQALLGMLVTGLIAGALQWRGVVPMTPAISLAAAALLGIVLMLPHLVDRLLSPRLSPIAAMLVFPTAQVSLEYGLNLVLPYATFGAFAYTQATIPLVTQIASLGGLWVVSFVIALAAPAIAHIVLNPNARSLPVSGLAGLVILGALGFGAVRLAGSETASTPTTKIIGLASKPSNLDAIIAATKGCGADACAQAKADSLSQTEALIKRTNTAVTDGAQIVVWSEVAAPVFASDEAGFIARLQAIARERQVWLAPALFVIEAGRPLSPNKVVLINAQGEIVLDHLKAKPVPGELSVNGTDTLKLAETPFGPVSLAICYDFDFPALARQAKDAALVLVPGSDWSDIDPLHPHMVALRAVENGFAVIRPSRESVSVAFDQYGRLLARAPWKDVAAPTLVAEVPQAVVSTLYSQIGDVFAYFCVLALAGLALLAFMQQRVVAK